MKKGFTLVELLAVVIILGILAVVIVPKIQQTIKDSKKNTYEASAHAIDREVEVFYANQKINQSNFNGCEYNFTTGNNTCEGFEFKGEKPESGGLKISKDGKSAFGLKFDDYCYSKGYNDDEINIIETDNCVIPKQIGEEVVISGEHFYVMDSNALETKLLAKYNINVGPDKNTNLPENRQHESLDGNGQNASGNLIIKISWTTYDMQTACPYFSDPAFLKEKYGNRYPAYIYDENHDTYYYLEAYKTFLGNVKEVRLPSLEEIKVLGCTEASCDNAYPWAYSTHYYTGTAKNNYETYVVMDSYGKTVIEDLSTAYACDYELRIPSKAVGLRPVVIVNTKDI